MCSTDVLDLENWPLFHGLDAAQLQTIYETMTPMRFPGRAPILRQGDSLRAIYLILSGTVKITSCGPNGAQVALGLVGAGAVLGELSAVDGEFHSADAVASESCQVLRIDKSDLDRHMMAMPRFLQNLGKLTCQRTRSSTLRIEILAMEDLPRRMAYQLVFMASEFSSDDTQPVCIRLRVTQGDLAELVRSSRTNVNSVLGRLSQEKLIAIGTGHRITLLNPRALLAWADRQHASANRAK